MKWVLYPHLWEAQQLTPPQPQATSLPILPLAFMKVFHPMPAMYYINPTSLPKNHPCRQIHIVDGKSTAPPSEPPHNLPTATNGLPTPLPSILRRSSHSSPSINPPTPSSTLHLDKPIIIKKGLIRPHSHRHDLSFLVKKPNNEEDEEPLVQKAL
jgi:hypothetical protein